MLNEISNFLRIVDHLSLNVAAIIWYIIVHRYCSHRMRAIIMSMFLLFTGSPAPLRDKLLLSRCIVFVYIHSRQTYKWQINPTRQWAHISKQERIIVWNKRTCRPCLTRLAHFVNKFGCCGNCSRVKISEVVEQYLSAFGKKMFVVS